MREETRRMIEELLKNQKFQELLNEVSLEIEMPSGDLNKLKRFFPKNAPITFENTKQAIDNYRACVITGTRNYLKNLLKGESDETPG